MWNSIFNYIYICIFLTGVASSNIDYARSTRVNKVIETKIMKQWWESQPLRTSPYIFLLCFRILITSFCKFYHSTQRQKNPFQTTMLFDTLKIRNFFFANYLKFTLFRFWIILPCHRNKVQRHLPREIASLVVTPITKESPVAPSSVLDESKRCSRRTRSGIVRQAGIRNPIPKGKRALWSPLGWFDSSRSRERRGETRSTDRPVYRMATYRDAQRGTKRGCDRRREGRASTLETSRRGGGTGSARPREGRGDDGGNRRTIEFFGIKHDADV